MFYELSLFLILVARLAEPRVVYLYLKILPSAVVNSEGSGRPRAGWSRIIQETRTTQNSRTAVVLRQGLVPDVGYVGDAQIVAATLISTTAGPPAGPRGAPAAYARHARMYPYVAYLHAHAGQPCLAYFRYHISGRSRRRARSMTRIVAAAELAAVAFFLFVSISLSLLPAWIPPSAPFSI